MKAIVKIIGFLFFLGLSAGAVAQVYHFEGFENDWLKGIDGHTDTSLYHYDTTDISWGIDIVPGSFTGSSYAYVRYGHENNYLEFTNTVEELVWYSDLIDLDPGVAVDIKATMLSFSYLENSDYMNIYYILNNSGTETPFPINGLNNGNFSDGLAEAKNITGSQVQIVVRVKNNDGNEHYGLDDVFVVSSNNVQAPNPGDILLTEFVTTSGISGSYLELYNQTDSVIYLEGCKIVSSGAVSSVLNFGDEIVGNYYIAPKGFLLLTASGKKGEFEATWGHTLANNVAYNRTWQDEFYRANTFQLKLGNVLIDETLEVPSSGSRVFQLPIGHWDKNKSVASLGSPGYLNDYEQLDEIDYVYMHDEWLVAQGLSASAPGILTYNSKAFVLEGNAPLADNAQVSELHIMPNTSVILSDENFAVHDKLFVADKGSVTITGSGELHSFGETVIEKIGYELNSDYNVWGSPFASDVKITSVFQDHFNCDIYAFEASTQSWKYDEAMGNNLNCNGNMYPMSAGLALSTINGEGNSDGNFDVGRGYFIPGNSNNTYEFFAPSLGELNNGDISVKIFGSSTTPSDGSNDWNLISNPYPSAVSVAKLLDLNARDGKIDNVIYLYNPGTGSNTLNSFSSYNSTDTEVMIASGQGFYVNANTEIDGLASTLEFNNAMRSSQNDNFRSILSYFGIYLNITDSLGSEDRTRIYFDMDAQDGYDKKYDALKMTNSDFNFASKVADNKLVFNGYSELTNMDEVIPLYFQTNQSSTFTISLDSLVGSFFSKDILLEDRETGVFYDLKKSDYVFSSVAHEWNDRFFLHVNHLKSNNGSGNGGVGNTDSTLTSINELELGLLDVWFANDQITIRLNAENVNISNLELIGLTGKQIWNQESNDSEVTISTAGLAKGVYFVKTELSNGSKEVSQVVVQ